MTYQSELMKKVNGAEKKVLTLEIKANRNKINKTIWEKELKEVYKELKELEQKEILLPNVWRKLISLKKHVKDALNEEIKW